MRALPLLGCLLAGCAQIVGADFDDLSLASGGAQTGGGGQGGAGGAGGAGGSVGPPSVYILEASNGGGFGDFLKSELDAREDFGEVTHDLVAIGAGLPTSAEVNAYDALVYISQSPLPGSQLTLRDLLQDYVESGGKLVMGRGAMCTPEGMLDMVDFVFMPKYAVMTAGELSFGAALVPSQTPAEFFEGVNGLTDMETCDAGLVDDATDVATWSNGDPLVATRMVNGRLRVDLNARPDTVPGAALFANAILSEP